MSDVQPTPISLLERLRQPGDRQAWFTFVHLYSPLLYRWSRQAGLSETDAADLVQDVFVILVRELPRFRYDASRSFRGWLRTIVQNRWRETRRRPQPAAADSVEALIAAEPTFLPGEEQERRQLLQQTLDLVKDEFQASTWEAFRLTLVQGIPPVHAAATLGLSLNAVYIARSRVLQRIRQLLRGLLD